MATNIDANKKAGVNEAFKKMTRSFGLAEGHSIDNMSDFLNNAQTLGDSTAAPGNATLNTTAGKSTIALGATAITVTNSMCEAGDLVLVTPLDLDTTLLQFKAVAGAGSFVVTGNAAATADWDFQWQLVKKAI